MKIVVIFIYLGLDLSYLLIPEFMVNIYKSPDYLFLVFPYHKPCFKLRH